MTHLDDSLREGHFARKQIFSKDWLIAWAHRSRFEIGLELARDCAGWRVLDYGCGDGTFLALLMAQHYAPKQAIGAELGEDGVRDCRARLGQSGLDFVRIAELDDTAQQSAYDAIFCMEVLEHVVEPDAVLHQFERLLASNGRLFISVPVETGLPMIVKQAARHIAGWRGIGDYPGISPYTWREYWAGVFAGRRQHIVRPIHRQPDGSGFHDHKGFNWMTLCEMLAQRFQIERRISSPMPWLPPQLASQVWLIARKQ